MTRFTNLLDNLPNGGGLLYATMLKLRRLLHKWVRHYNEGRPHMSLGPGMPQPHASLPASLHEHRHQCPEHLRVAAGSVLGGLHHEYRLEEKAA
jgi:hypothetical protein